MLFKLAFKYFSIAKRIDVLREKGILLGTRLHSNRKVYLYMLHDFFIEVVYQADDLDLQPEKMQTFSNLDNLNSYLEREFRAAF
jgi:hypothetical protein